MTTPTPGALASEVAHVLTSAPAGPLPGNTTAGGARSALVHRGPGVDASLRSWQALGATVGQHVLLRTGAGSDVMRHELSHVLQNRGQDVDLSQGVTMGAPGAAAETSPTMLVNPGPQVIRRRIDNFEDPDDKARRLAAAAEARRAREAKTEAWRAQVVGQAGGDLRDVAGDLKLDIERSGLAVLGARSRALEKISAELPTGFAADWVAASMAAEILRNAMLQPDMELAADVQDLARDRLVAFYWGLVSWQIARYYRAVTAAQNAMLVWRMSQMPVAGTRFADRRTPPDASPPPRPTSEVSSRKAVVQRASKRQEWLVVLDGFERSATLMDDWTGELLGRKAPEVMALQQAVGLYGRQKELSTRRPDAIKIPAVFYPKEEETEEQGKKRAVAYPWFFYLFRSADTIDWVLEDLTADKRVNVHDQTMTEGLERYIRSVNHFEEKVDPPPELWQELNSKLRFPKGELHLTQPSKTVYILETTEPTSLSEYLGYAALAVGLIALTLGTAGMGTAAAVAVFGSSALGVAGTVAGLSEKEQHGMATSGDRAKAALFIAADIASALTLGLGKVAQGAARAGSLASTTARLVGRVFVPVAGATLALDAARLYVMTDQFVDQFNAVANQPGLTPDQRSIARTKIVLMGLATGVLSLWSMRTTVKDIRSLRTVTADELIPGTGAAAGTTSKVPFAVEAPATAGDVRLGKARLETEAVLDPTLSPGTIEVRLTRNKLGLVSEIGVAHGPMKKGMSPDLWARDLAHHHEVAKLAQGFSGLLGEIRELLARVGSTLTGRRRGPLELELDLAKLEGRIQDRLNRLASRGLAAQERKLYEKEVESFSNQIEGHRQAILRGDPRTGRIAQKGTPDGHPTAPVGYTYKYSTVRQRWDVVPDVAGGLRLRVEVDPGTGLPTGRFSNGQHVDDLHIVGLSVKDPVALAKLKELGYFHDPGTSTIRPAAGLDPTQVAAMTPLRVVDGKISFTPEVQLGRATLGDASFYHQFYGRKLNTEEMVALHPAAVNETEWVRATPAIARGGYETQLHRASQYGVDDYVRYHILGPGTGLERFRIFLAPEVANQFANHQIEGFIRSFVKGAKPGQKIFFNVKYATFSGSELRPFIDGMLTSGNQQILRLLARSGGRFERFLKSAQYEIKIVDAAGKETFYTASITVNLPSSGGFKGQAPVPIP
ncbi:DUF4157 domain-containing protein [Paeniglutamicibacter antarcticus]|uniref:DUF4157 domain-containing protein n=1 Tax=Arthrobacter terrae TaxID=2935737 RepID=A0A931G4I2_9MICC|nr:DUF4157 domain-containing protein [Arthrobacter terrae]MBG0738445.1 DUF4157 domain-containing protein [Arthrobacter terrae]